MPLSAPPLLTLQILEQLAAGLDVRRLLVGGLRFVGDEAFVDDVGDETVPNDGVDEAIVDDGVGEAVRDAVGDEAVPDDVVEDGTRG